MSNWPDLEETVIESVPYANNYACVIPVTSYDWELGIVFF